MGAGYKILKLIIRNDAMKEECVTKYLDARRTIALTRP